MTEVQSTITLMIITTTYLSTIYYQLIHLYSRLLWGTNVNKYKFYMNFNNFPKKFTIFIIINKYIYQL